MAKKAKASARSKVKAKARKTSAVKRAMKKKKTAKAKKALSRSVKKVAKAPTRAARRFAGAMSAVAPPAAAALAAPRPALSNASRAAVTACVNAFLDATRRGWNDDLQGNNRTMAQLNYPPQSIPAPVLTWVKNCLNRRNPRFDFIITPQLVATCAAGNVSNLKFQIYQVTF